MYINHFLDMVAEVTQPSLGVGYEIGRAVGLEMKILCLFRPDSDTLSWIFIVLAHSPSKQQPADRHVTHGHVHWGALSRL
jgi:hypothetical protein